MLTDARLLRAYRNFKAIEPTAWLKIARFFEQHKKELRQLDFDRFFDCLLAHSRALLELEKFEECLAATDEAIEAVFDQNVDWHDGEDILERALLQKAVALAGLGRSAEAERVLKELLKLRPESEQGKKVWKKIDRESRPKLRQRFRAWSLGLIFLSAIFSASHFLIVRPFFPQLDRAVFWVWTGLLFLGCLAMLAGEFWLYIAAHFEVERFAKTAMEKTRRQRD